MSEQPDSSDPTDSVAPVAEPAPARDDRVPGTTPADEVEPIADPAIRRQAIRDVVIYTFLRIGMFLILWVLIGLIAALFGIPVPAMISAAFALLILFPLSMFVFRGLRSRVTASLALWSEQRKAHREWVREQIAGR